MSKVKYLSYLLLGLSAVFSIYMIVQSGNMGIEKWKIEPDTVAFKSLDAYLMWAYVLTGVALLIAIVFSVINMIRNPKNIKKTLMSIGLMVIVAIVSYLAGSSYLPAGATTAPIPSDLAVRWVDAGLVAMYILVAAAILAIVVGGVRNFIKNR